MKNFYIGDWHYAHANCIAFDNRPFKTVEEMNDSLIENWNSVVGDKDYVYVLGDMFWCGSTMACSVLDQLKGHKILLVGNHDKFIKNELAQSKFDLIKEYLEIEDNDKRIVLSHYPSPCFKNHYYGWYHFYAHVHASFEWNMMEHQKYLMEQLYDTPCKMFNVGAMMPYMNYTPRQFNEIVRE